MNSNETPAGKVRSHIHKIHGGRYHLVAGDATRSGDVLAEAVRFYKSQGSTFSGWVIRSLVEAECYSDPIANRDDMLAVLPEYAPSKGNH